MSRFGATPTGAKARRRLLLLLLVALALFPERALAQYRWIDDQGKAHYIQGPNSVPERYPSEGGPNQTGLPAQDEMARPPALPETAKMTDQDLKLLLDLQGRLQALVTEERLCEQRPNAVCHLRVQHERATIETVLSNPLALQSLREARQQSWQSFQRDTWLLLRGLQHVAVRLRDGSVPHDEFVARMEAFRKDLEAFGNRYAPWLKARENQKLVETLMEAGEVLIASADTWKREAASEREVREIHGGLEIARRRAADGSLSSRAALVQDEHNLRATLQARDKAASERARQWETFQRLVIEASAIAKSR